VSAALSAREMLDREFLQVRSRLLDVAASFDRIDALEGSVADDPRMLQIRRAVELLSGQGLEGPRAEQVQLIFSRPYREGWRNAMGLEE
jgi:hypothetical protein